MAESPVARPWPAARARHRRLERHRPRDCAGGRARRRRRRADLSLEPRRRRRRGRARSPRSAARTAVEPLDLADEAVDSRGSAPRPAPRSAASTSGSTTPAPTSSPGRRRAVHVEKLDLLLAVDLRGTMLASWEAARAARRAGRRRRHHQHELGSRADRDGGHQPADVRRGEGRRARVQQVARALGRAARARQRARAGLDRHLVRRRPRRATPTARSPTRRRCGAGARPTTWPAPPSFWPRRPRRS